VISGNNCINNTLGTVQAFGATTIVRDDIGGYIDQAFVLSITNNAGTLQHSYFAQAGNLVLGNYSSRIPNGTATGTATPTGADATTPMANGGKIGSASINDFWCDTAVQNVAQADLMATIVYNDTGNACFVRPEIVSININGVTQNRLMFNFTIPLTGAAFALTVGNIPAGKTLQIQFQGRLN
jgi:hypothetical protein